MPTGIEVTLESCMNGEKSLVEPGDLKLYIIPSRFRIGVGDTWLRWIFHLAMIAFLFLSELDPDVLVV